MEPPAFTSAVVMTDASRSGSPRGTLIVTSAFIGTPAAGIPSSTLTRASSSKLLGGMTTLEGGGRLVSWTVIGGARKRFRYLTSGVSTYELDPSRTGLYVVSISWQVCADPPKIAGLSFWRS